MTLAPLVPYTPHMTYPSSQPLHCSIVIIHFTIDSTSRPMSLQFTPRGYSLPDCLNYYPYPTRNFLLPDRVEGSEENSMIYKSEEWKCNTFVMMDIFIIPRNNNFTLQLCQSPFIQVYHIIKFIKKSQFNRFNRFNRFQ